MLETDKSRLSLVCLGVSMLCLWVALLLSNVVFKVKHAWNFGWLGCLVAFAICCSSPDFRRRAEAAKLLGVGICVAFYVTYYGHRSLYCRLLLCGLPLELLVLTTFFGVHSVQWWLWREQIRNDDGGEQKWADEGKRMQMRWTFC